MTIAPKTAEFDPAVKPAPLPAVPSPPPSAVSPAAAWRRLVIPVFAVTVAGGLMAFTSDRWNAWQGAASVQTTDNATIRAEMTRLSSRVSGNVKAVAVADFQAVKAGDLLIEVDPADYEAAVAQAEAGVAAAKAALANLANQKTYQRAVVAQAEAQRQAGEARRTEARQEQERQSKLLDGGLSGTRQKVEQATANLDAANANLAQNLAAIAAQKGQLDVLAGQEDVLAANLRAAEATLATAQLRLGYTRIVAPFDGVVGERQIQPGDYVNAGSNLITVVPLPDVYVTANYKETQLTHVTPGQPVDVSVDMFPDQILNARVARLAPASGATFALLPPDNATGNFTKVVQRIPVRIEFEPGQKLVEQLRPGMSVTTSIRVTGRN